MRLDGAVRLNQSLALASAWRDWHAESALDLPPDPLHLDLPPVLAGAAPTPQALGVVGNLYLMAELEQAGVVPAVESLVEARFSLSLHGGGAAAKLDDFQLRSRSWFDRPHRNLIYARIFGIGGAATNDAGASVNRSFEQYLTALCLAISEYARDYEFGQQPGPEQEVAVRQAAANLVTNLGGRVTDAVLFAGRHLQEQLPRALDILADPTVGALFGAHGVWSTLRALLGDQAPDLGRLVSRGQYGQRLIQWLATVLSQLEVTDTHVVSSPLLGPSSPIIHYAEEWLAASGVPATPDAAPQPALQGAAA